jgi:hypothetical protein
MEPELGRFMTFSLAAVSPLDCSGIGRWNQQETTGKLVTSIALDRCGAINC